MSSLAEHYLQAIQERLIGIEQQLPQISAAATIAAQHACNGGRVWAVSDEEGFVSELQHRAAGLMMVRGIPGDNLSLDDSVVGGDVVIAATQGLAPDRQLALLAGLAERGVAVTLIGSADGPVHVDTLGPLSITDCGQALRLSLSMVIARSVLRRAPSMLLRAGRGASNSPTLAPHWAVRQCF